VNTAVVITIVFGILAANVATMGLVVKSLGDRIGDIVGRMDRLEKRNDDRFDSIEVRLDGIAETLARFDERIKTVERRS
jgi:hypothetical protein